MKKLFLLVCYLPLVGCSSSPMTAYQMYKAGKPIRTFYKAGFSTARIRSDLNLCREASFAKAPIQMQYYRTPTYTTPVSTSCNSYSSSYGGGSTYCSSYGGQTVGGYLRSFDGNAAARNHLVDLCMANKGYGVVKIPSCPKGVSIAGQNFSVLPRMTDRTCYQVFDKNDKAVVGEIR